MEGSGVSMEGSGGWVLDLDLDESEGVEAGPVPWSRGDGRLLDMA